MRDRCSPSGNPTRLESPNERPAASAALAERLSKQNLLYQLHLGETSKQEMHDTSAELDRILAILEAGSTFYSVAGPPSEAVRKQIHEIDLRSILKIQSALVEDIERFTAVLGRFAAGEYGRDLEPLMKF